MPVVIPTIINDDYIHKTRRENTGSKLAIYFMLSNKLAAGNYDAALQLLFNEIFYNKLSVIC